MNWSWVKLQEICSIGSGGTPLRSKSDRYYGGTIPWVKSGELKENIILNTEESITELALKESSAKLVPEGSLLVAMYGATVGRLAVLGVKAATNQAVCHLTPISTHQIDADYLFHVLQTKVPEWLAARVGGAQPNISQGIIKNTKIPLPPLSEQKRIAAILDKAEGILRKREKAIELTNSFLRSVFLELFGDPGTNPKGWACGTIRDLVSSVKYGTSGKAGTKGRYEILRMNNITYAGQIDLTSLKYIDIDPDDEEKYLTQNGDILFNRTNSKELVGKSAVYCFDKPRAIAGYLIRVRPNSKANSEYIAAYLNSKHGKDTLQHMCKSIIGMANINAQELQEIKIQIPPIELQNRFAQIVKKVRASTVEHTNALNKANLLFEALSANLFSGSQLKKSSSEITQEAHALQL
jgi:type I restriction enzyme, S subunit